MSRFSVPRGLPKQLQRLPPPGDCWSLQISKPDGRSPGSTGRLATLPRDKQTERRFLSTPPAASAKIPAKAGDALSPSRTMPLPPSTRWRSKSPFLWAAVSAKHPKRRPRAAPPP